MSFRSLTLFVVIGLSVYRQVLSGLLCKDSRIDSVTYSNDQQKYFFTSGGYYWWIGENEFPPADSAAKKLPTPFKMGHASVYVDSDNGCAAYLTEGVTAKEKVVWVEELVDNQHKLMAFDTKTNEFRPQAINYNQDRCIGRAKIDWAAKKTIDAMFVRNYMEIYVVMGNKYAMVDCSTLCKGSDAFPDAKIPSSTEDFGTKDKIFAMFIKKDKHLTMFHERVFYKVTIQNTKDGKITAVKEVGEHDNLRDFMKIEEPGECSSGEQPSAPEPPSNDNTGGDEPPAGAEQPSGDEKSDESGFPWVIVIVVAVIVIIAIIGVIAFLSMSKKSSKDAEADKEKPAVGQKSAKAMPPKSQLKGASTMTNRSNADVTAVSSKAVSPKVSAKPSAKK